MKFALLFSLLVGFHSAQAKVAEKTPTLETPNVQSELMKELDETPEDLDFDSDDDLQIQSIDEEKLVIDSEIEKIAAERMQAPKVEAKANTKTTEVKKK